MATDSSIPVNEYEALRTGRGFVELPAWTSVSLSGADRQTFLNSFCTNDVKRLIPGTSCEAFFTNVKGKILGHGLVTCRDDELVIITVPAQAGRLIEHFDRYVIREDVMLRDATPERAYFLLAGEMARETVGGWAQAVVEQSHSVRMLPHVAAEVSGIPVRYVAWPLFGSCFASLLEASSSDTEGLARELAGQGFIRCGQEAFTACRIEAGMPLYGIEFDESNLPQEIGRDAEAISFTKGCYLGQETVARIDAMGHVNQQIRGVRFAGTKLPAAGTELFHAATKVGRVTSAAFSPQLNAPLALAMVRREANDVGARLESEVGECEIVSLPVGDKGTRR